MLLTGEGNIVHVLNINSTFYQVILLINFKFPLKFYVVEMFVRWEILSCGKQRAILFYQFIVPRTLTPYNLDRWYSPCHVLLWDFHKFNVLADCVILSQAKPNYPNTENVPASFHIIHTSNIQKSSSFHVYTSFLKPAVSWSSKRRISPISIQNRPIISSFSRAWCKHTWMDKFLPFKASRENDFASKETKV